MLDSFDTILLDMNDTFMFGHDRFGAGEDYGASFRRLGGSLPDREAARLIQAVFDYLMPLYPNTAYHENFPGLEAALDVVAPEHISDSDRQHLIATFSCHEIGTVSPEYVAVLHRLRRKFRLGLIADIWAPRDMWVQEFERAGILDTFEVLSFSSDDGVVKPSAKPFYKVMDAMKADPATTVMIGDSVRRDLGGATAAGLPCILVGGRSDPAAYGVAPTLLDLLS